MANATGTEPSLALVLEVGAHPCLEVVHSHLVVQVQALQVTATSLEGFAKAQLTRWCYAAAGLLGTITSASASSPWLPIQLQDWSRRTHVAVVGIAALSYATSANGLL